MKDIKYYGAFANNEELESRKRITKYLTKDGTIKEEDLYWSREQYSHYDLIIKDNGIYYIVETKRRRVLSTTYPNAKLEAHKGIEMKQLAEAWNQSAKGYKYSSNVLFIADYKDKMVIWNLNDKCHKIEQWNTPNSTDFGKKGNRTADAYTLEFYNKIGEKKYDTADVEK